MIEETNSEIILSSEGGVDYIKLRDLLAAHNWFAADQETLKIMLQFTGGSYWGTAEILKDFPSKNLQTLNSLWLKYSNGHYGFSVQKEIWLSLGGEINHETERLLCERLGWGKDVNEILESSIQYFSIRLRIGEQSKVDSSKSVAEQIRESEILYGFNTPRGHLPVAYLPQGECGPWGVRGIGMSMDGMLIFLSRPDL